MEKFIHVDRCDSTQDLLKEQLTQNPQSELTVSCEHQTQGRGRGRNIWQDSPGTLCFSMSIAPHEKTTFTALEISTLIADFFHLKGREIKLKWPNDLINSEGKKCGGILVQNLNLHFLAGIGLNLFHNSLEFGGIYESSFELDKKNWAQELSQYIRHHRFDSTDLLASRWMSYCAHQNKEVKITEGFEETYGRFIGLGEFGEAIIDNGAGTHKIFNGSLRLV